jgi:P27 family predicted phage terminase small subunit
MAKVGRKPKPLAQHLLEGTRPRMYVDLDGMKIASDLPPAMPTAVLDDPLQLAEWNRIIAAVPPDFYNALDSALLCLYVQALALMHEAHADILARGITIQVERTNKSGDTYEVEQPNPAVSVWKSASETVLKCADRLGLAPGVRARLQLPQRDEKPTSKFGGLLATRPT